MGLETWTAFVPAPPAIPARAVLAALGRPPGGGMLVGAGLATAAMRRSPAAG